MTPEDILWKAHELGIKDEIHEEVKRIKHHFPYDLNAAYTKAFSNVTERMKSDKKDADKFEGTIWPDYNEKQNEE